MDIEKLQFVWNHMLTRMEAISAAVEYGRDTSIGPCLALDDNAPVRMYRWFDQYALANNIMPRDTEIMRARVALNEARELETVDDGGGPDSDSIVSLPDDSDSHAYVQSWVLVDIGRLCRGCEELYPDDGEGWDGLCGNCADKAARAEGDDKD